MSRYPEALVRFFVEPGHPMVVASAIMEVFSSYAEACHLDEETGQEAVFSSPSIPGTPEAIAEGLQVLAHFFEHEDPLLTLDFSQNLWGSKTRPPDASKSVLRGTPIATFGPGRLPPDRASRLASEAFHEHFLPLCPFWDWSPPEVPSLSEGDAIEIVRALLPSEGAIADFLRDYFPDSLPPILEDYISQACPHLRWTREKFVHHFQCVLGLKSDTILMPTPCPTGVVPYTSVELAGTDGIEIKMARFREARQDLRLEVFLEMVWTPFTPVQKLSYVEKVHEWDWSGSRWGVGLNEEARIWVREGSLVRYVPNETVAWSREIERVLMAELRKLDESVGYLLSRDLLGASTALAHYFGGGITK